MPVTGNVHDFPLWIAAAGNFAFWIAACWLLGALFSKLEESRRGAGWEPHVTAARGAFAGAGGHSGGGRHCGDGSARPVHAAVAREPGRDGDCVPRASGWRRWNGSIGRTSTCGTSRTRRGLPNATDEDLAAVKRRIDTTNQLRNDLAEELDRTLLDWLEGNGLPNPGAPLNSESPGLMIDRLSILALKIYHTREEAVRHGRAGRTRGAQPRAAGGAGGAAQ